MWRSRCPLQEPQNSQSSASWCALHPWVKQLAIGGMSSLLVRCMEVSHLFPFSSSCQISHRSLCPREVSIRRQAFQETYKPGRRPPPSQQALNALKQFVLNFFQREPVQPHVHTREGWAVCSLMRISGSLNAHFLKLLQRAEEYQQHACDAAEMKRGMLGCRFLPHMLPHWSAIAVLPQDHYSHSCSVHV